MADRDGEMMNEGSGARRLLFLGAGLILLVGVLGMTWIGLNNQQESGRDSGASARQAYRQAWAFATTQWEADAGLAEIQGQWFEMGAASGQGVEWSFKFYSPSSHHFAVVLVDGERVSMVREVLSPSALATFSDREWRVDSDQAHQAWLAEGGSSIAAVSYTHLRAHET